MVLRPVSILVFGFALWNLSPAQARANSALLALAALTVASVAVQLIPLPPSIWSQFPGRAVLADIDKLAELGATWRPISMAPTGTWNALYALFAPLAVLLLAIQLPVEQRFYLIPLILVLGAISALLGLLQIAGPTDGPLYFYRITNADSAVGLFSNRNHAAAFLACLFPLLATFASTHVTSSEQLRRRSWIASAAGAVMVPLILVTGSRAGLVLGVLALATVPLLYNPPAAMRRPREAARLRVAFLLGSIAVAGLAVIFVTSWQDRTFSRLVETGSEELRLQVWGPIWDMALRYFPLGTGAGSFVEIFQLHEAHDQLRPNYLNHAHNDWLELLLTGGLVAGVLMAAAVAAWALRSVAVWRQADGSRTDRALARVGSIVLLLLGLASLGDYPLRTPALACLAAVAAVWLAGTRGPASNRSDRTAERRLA